MKRIASRALVAALAAALALSGVAAAKDHPNHGKGGHHGAPVVHTDKAPTTGASLRTKGNASHPGGVFRVLGVLKAGSADRPATIDAIVHFASGDVAVVLTRRGKGAAYHANVPVPDAEPAGVVNIDATATVLGAPVTATGSGKVIVGGDEANATDESEVTDGAEAPETPDATDGDESPETSDADKLVFPMNADNIRKLIAYLESLLD